MIFLAEAFTRPKMMYRLAKIGFSQSYTYFTWRNTKQRAHRIFDRADDAPVPRDFFRPNFFVNTPDINPFFLQTSGRPGFPDPRGAGRDAVGTVGHVFSGFELCESAPLPGREEYLDSEKYQIRVRDLARAGQHHRGDHALNRIRRANPALQSISA